jgi:hypothetical protein
MGERGQRAGWRETSLGRGAGLVRRAGLRVAEAARACALRVRWAARAGWAEGRGVCWVGCAKRGERGGPRPRDGPPGKREGAGPLYFPFFYLFSFLFPTVSNQILY